MSKGRKRNPKARVSAQEPAPKRTKTRELLSNLFERPLFSFWLADKDGDWSLQNLNEREALNLIKFLTSMSELTWTEVRNLQAGGDPLYHSQPVESLCPSAQKRIRHLKLDELDDKLFRFRLDSTSRLWGYELDGIFHVVWWDPEHTVYPTKPH